MNDLLKGAYDLHVHAGPDLMPRSIDDLEMAQRAIASGMRGFAIKSHYFCTAERAKIARKLYPACNSVGTITLNAPVGGINPIAVEMAGRAGARLVWFPTVDAGHEQEFLAKHAGNPGVKLAFWAKIQLEMKAEGILAPRVDVLKDGRLTDEAMQVLDIMAKYGMILATAHLSHEETFALVKAARERKVERVIVTHVTFPSTFYTVDEQRELVRLGAYMEQCYTTPATGKASWETCIDQIKAIGPERCVIGTDLGQPGAILPDEGLLAYAEKLLAAGLTEDQVRLMIVKNPTDLVEGA